MERFTIPLLISFPFIMSIITFILATIITNKERQELSLSKNKTTILILVIAALLLCPFALIILIPLSIYILRKDKAKATTEDEEQKLNLSKFENKFKQSKKIALGFKIATVLFFSTPLLLLLPSIINPPHNDGAQGALFFIFVPSALCILIPVITSLHGYSFLFYTTSDKKAFYILAIPFIPAILLGILAAIKAVQGDWAIVNGHLAAFIIIPTILFLGILTIILLSIRKRFLP